MAYVLRINNYEITQNLKKNLSRNSLCMYLYFFLIKLLRRLVRLDIRLLKMQFNSLMAYNYLRNHGEFKNTSQLIPLYIFLLFLDSFGFKLFHRLVRLDINLLRVHNLII